MVRRFDGPSAAVIAVTLVLFVAALFFKGFTHDLLLEAGVFLVSVKLIRASWQAADRQKELLARLDALAAAVARLEERGGR